MPRSRKIDGKQAEKVLKLARRGLSDAQIVATLELDCDPKAVARCLARLNFKRPPIKPSTARARGGTGDPTPRSTSSAASSFDEVLASVEDATEIGVVDETLKILRAALRTEIGAADRARVASSISTLLGRRRAVLTAEAEAKKTQSADLSWVAAKLKNFERQDKEAKAAKAAALDRALANATPELAEAVRRAVNGPGLFAVGDDEVEDEEEPRAAQA